MTPSSFISPTKDSPASLSPVESMSRVEAHESRGVFKMLCESQRRRIDESMRVAFLSTLREEELERYQSELERKMVKRDASSLHGEYLERNQEIQHSNRDEGGLNQTIMQEVIEKMMSPLNLTV